MKYSIQNAAPKGSTLIIPTDKEHLEETLGELSSVFKISFPNLRSDFTAEKGEHVLLYPADASFERIYLLGLGKNPQLRNVGETVISFVQNHRKKWSKTVAVETDWLANKFGEYTLTKLVCSIEGGLFDLGMYKTDEKTKLNWKETVFVLADHEQPGFWKTKLKNAQAIAEGQNQTRLLVWEPANKLTPDTFAETAVKLGKKFAFDVEIFDEKELKKRGFGGLIAVGKGSASKPRLIKLHYKGKKSSDKKSVALIGKGLTFDTGGNSIKSATNMHFMKCDMAGAATVAGVFCTLSDIKYEGDVFGFLAVAENMLDGESFRPSDVISIYGGKTVEVLDTDAEGRLVLADALSYAASEFKPDIMIDLATLTGSVVTALGYAAAGLFTQNSELSVALEMAGHTSGERVWRLPLWDDYASHIACDIADVKNLGGPAAGSITAAKFLEKFTHNHESWAHLDIAGMALQSAGYAKDRIATGYGVELLCQYLAKL